MDKQERMRPSVKSVCDFELSLPIDVMINDFNDLFAELVEIKNRRVSVKADCVELVAVLYLTQMNTFIITSQKLLNA